jgi:hypothetical protein
MTTPEWYAEWRATLDFESVDYGTGGLLLFTPEDVPQGQLGYTVTTDGRSLVGVGPGDWRPEWVVIGYETACGDPIFASQESPHPVFTAMHGQGSWDPQLVAQSLEVFRDCLLLFQRFAIGRNGQLERDANLPTAEERAQYLQNIRTMTGGDGEALGFWAVQGDIDLDATEF